MNTDVDTESMLWLGIAASSYLTRKTTGLAPVTSSKLHRPAIINNNDMVVNKNNLKRQNKSECSRERLGDYWPLYFDPD